MKLIIEFYEPSNISRLKEYEWCIERNTQSRLFDEIHIFVEEGSTLPERFDKFDSIVKHTEPRKTFQELFNYCNENFKDEICIISNTDIIFTDSFKDLTKENVGNKFIALTRWDLFPNGEAKFFHNQYSIEWFSQDSWTFKTPIPIKDADFFMGKPGCDNKICFLAHTSGMVPTNPSLKLITKHLHITGYRTYVGGGPETVPDPWMGLRPTDDIKKISEKRMLGEWRIKQ